MHFLSYLPALLNYCFAFFQLGEKIYFSYWRRFPCWLIVRLLRVPPKWRVRFWDKKHALKGYFQVFCEKSGEKWRDMGIFV